MSGSITIRLSELGIPENQDRAVDSNVSETILSDEALIAEVCLGGREALAILFRRYARVVRGVALRVLKDGAEADDLVQDVFLLIHRLCRAFDSSKASAQFWILQMTYRRAISRRSRTRWRRTTPTPPRTPAGSPTWRCSSAAG